MEGPALVVIVCGNAIVGKYRSCAISNGRYRVNRKSPPGRQRKVTGPCDGVSPPARFSGSAMTHIPRVQRSGRSDVGAYFANGRWTSTVERRSIAVLTRDVAKDRHPTPISNASQARDEPRRASQGAPSPPLPPLWLRSFSSPRYMP